jgi:uncharacterized protein involved in outer membrane biogenesis
MRYYSGENMKLVGIGLLILTMFAIFMFYESMSSSGDIVINGTTIHPEEIRSGHTTTISIPLIGTAKAVMVKNYPIITTKLQYNNDTIDATAVIVEWNASTISGLFTMEYKYFKIPGTFHGEGTNGTYTIHGTFKGKGDFTGYATVIDGKTYATATVKIMGKTIVTSYVK